VLESAVVVAGDGAGADVHVAPDFAVANVGEVIRLGADIEPRFLDLHEVADVDVRSEFGLRPDTGKGADASAGTITCNYDGAFKHKTIIEDDVFIGSDTQLVAPVRVGRGSTIAAGTTVTEDVEADRLVLSRVRQKTISGWQRPRKPGKN